MRKTALFSMTLPLFLVGSLTSTSAGQTTTPIIWGFQVPLGGAMSDSRFTKMVRVFANQDPEDAADYAAYLSGTVPSGRVCVLLQNFGDAPGFCKMSQHPGDALDDPVYSVESGNPDISTYTLWTADGRTETATWMSAFISEYVLESGETPDRFHFDNEALLVGCCSRDWLRLFDAMQVDSMHSPASRWDTEVIPGFGGQTLEEMFDESTLWNDPNDPADALDYNSSDWMLHSDNLLMSSWLIGIGYQILDGAMDDTAYSLIKGEWAGCKTSNYLTSCRFDGDNGYYYTSEYSAGTFNPPLLLHWQGSADLQAPYFYIVDDDHMIGGESLWDASMRVHASNLDGLIRSFGGNKQGEITPWISVVNQQFTIDSTTYTINEADTRRLLALLRSRDIGEFIAFNNDVGSPTGPVDCNDESAWNLFLAAVDGVWETAISGASVVTGTTGQSPMAPLTFALSDPLNVTAAMIGAGDYRATVETTYGSSFASTPCKLAAVIEGTTTGASAVTASVEFYNFNTTSWDSASAPSPDYLGVPNQIWRVISATNHIDPTGTHDIKVRVKYTSAATFTVALDCVQAVTFAIESLSKDANRDGVCNSADLTYVLGNYTASTCAWTHGDLNGDGAVNTADLTIVLGSCTPTCP